MDEKSRKLHEEFEQIDFIKFEKNLYQVGFDYSAKPNGMYVDKTNNQIRKDCCHYLQGAWRLYQELNK